MKNLKLGALLLCLATGQAMALGPSVDLRLAGGSLELDDDIDNIESDSSGYDLRAFVPINDLLFVRGQYSSASGDEVEVNGSDFDFDLDVDTLRGGLGLQGQSASLRYYGIAEAAKLKLTFDGDAESDTGFGISGGLSDLGTGAFLWNVELGLVSIGDADGATFDFTLGYRFNPMFAVILGGQSYALENDGADFTYSQGSLGLRISF